MARDGAQFAQLTLLRAAGKTSEVTPPRREYAVIPQLSGSGERKQKKEKGDRKDGHTEKRGKAASTKDKRVKEGKDRKGKSEAGGGGSAVALTGPAPAPEAPAPGTAAGGGGRWVHISS